MGHLVTLLNFFLNAYHSKRKKLFKGLIYSTTTFFHASVVKHDVTLIALFNTSTIQNIYMGE